MEEIKGMSEAEARKWLMRRGYGLGEIDEILNTAPEAAPAPKAEPVKAAPAPKAEPAPAPVAKAAPAPKSAAKAAPKPVATSASKASK